MLARSDSVLSSEPTQLLLASEHGQILSHITEKHTLLEKTYEQF